ncbi:MAG: NHL repeat-containing protein, partial [Candidatus Marinimicrobia bacterium]|nr:NHL repeat-containing protein [Candidatus Neomarinimicrobiota bacterium]
MSKTLIGLLLLLISSVLFGQTVADQTTLVHPQRKHAPVRKAGKYLLKFYLGFGAKIDDPQGLTTVKLNSRNDPDVPKDDDEITVYGVNRGNNTIIYNNSLLSVAIYGKNLPDKQKLNSPHGITANPAGRVLVADTGNDRIVELRDSGTLSHLRTYGKKGNGRGEFNAPLDVKLDSQGNFYVLDSGNNRIQFFSEEGEVLKIWGEEDGLILNDPISMAVTDVKEK